MTPVQNYIDLFKQNRALIDRGSAGALNSARDNALDCLLRYGLPHKGLEEYLHTDVGEWFEPDWRLSIVGSFHNLQHDERKSAPHFLCV